MFGLLFGFKGRVSRTTFWVIKGVIIVANVAIVLAILKAGHVRAGDRHGFEHAWRTLDHSEQFAVIGVWLVMLWIMLATVAKRFHDLDEGGWRFVIPRHYGRCGFQAGTVGPNRYGPDPLAG